MEEIKNNKKNLTFWKKFDFFFKFLIFFSKSHRCLENRALYGLFCRLFFKRTAATPPPGGRSEARGMVVGLRLVTRPRPSLSANQKNEIPTLVQHNFFKLKIFLKKS